MALTEHILKNDFISLTMCENTTYGLVVKEIKNLQDGVTITPHAQSPCQMSARNFAANGAETYTTLAIPTSYAAPTIGTKAANTEGVADNLGARSFLRWTGSFDNVGTSTADINFVWEAQILDASPERIRFALYRDWATQTGSAHTIVWTRPINLTVPVLPKDHYLVAINNGMSTRSPQTDLAGNGSTYKFKTSAKFNPESYDPNSATDDTYEVFYPGAASMPLSGYGSRSSDATMYIHDGLAFQGTRIKDTCSTASISFVHDYTS